jgi:hypothetical protein
MASQDNRIEKRADLYNTEADARARRVANSWDQVPAESRVLTPENAHAMWHYTMSPQPEQDFWSVHDATLQQTLAGNPQPKPEDVQLAHKQAELAAIQAVYPYRLMVAPVQDLEPQAAVQRAERAHQMVQRVEQGGAGG